MRLFAIMICLVLAGCSSSDDATPAAVVATDTVEASDVPFMYDYQEVAIDTRVSGAIQAGETRYVRFVPKRTQYLLVMVAGQPDLDIVVHDALGKVDVWWGGDSTSEATLIKVTAHNSYYIAAHAVSGSGAFELQILTPEAEALGLSKDEQMLVLEGEGTLSCESEFGEVEATLERFSALSQFIIDTEARVIRSYSGPIAHSVIDEQIVVSFPSVAEPVADGDRARAYFYHDAVGLNADGYVVVAFDEDESVVVEELWEATQTIKANGGRDVTLNCLGYIDYTEVLRF
ncbi:MAG: hypothetical protein R3183_10720 [Oleiphilaceae bacterium]|nr:hypothetical protein [Oleiphilaceae bacterium]